MAGPLALPDSCLPAAAGGSLAAAFGLASALDLAGCLSASGSHDRGLIRRAVLMSPSLRLGLLYLKRKSVLGNLFAKDSSYSDVYAAAGRSACAPEVDLIVVP